MNATVDEVARAVLYEGYILYPYRASSVKNQRERFTFGRVYPEAYNQAQNGAEPCRMQTECLARVLNENAHVNVTVRFLQVMRRDVGVLPAALPDWPPNADSDEPAFEIVPRFRTGETVLESWQEAVEREVNFTGRFDGKKESVPFHFPPSRLLEPVHDSGGHIVAVLVRQTGEIQGRIEIARTQLSGGVMRIAVSVENKTPIAAEDFEDGEALLARTFASTHTILRADGAEFVSLLDPPEELRTAAADCQNLHTWPVLAGNEQWQQRDTMLSSPIILYDYPRIAPQSPGDLFDGTEIDEILTLRIMTMTESEKREMRNVDAHARRLLERTEGISQSELLNMHGRMQPSRSFEEQIFGTGTKLEGISSGDVFLKPGDRVRVRPKGRADVMDMAIAGRIAIIEAVEQDAEERIHLALVLEDDPGRDLGFLRQPGHRFFYGVDEIEPLEAAHA
jgi:hydrogenase maturation protease